MSDESFFYRADSTVSFPPLTSDVWRETADLFTHSVEVGISGTITLPREQCERLLHGTDPSAYYTAIWRYDTDPFLRYVDLRRDGWRAVFRQMKDVLVYEVLKAAGRVQETSITVTLPDVKLSSGS